MDVSLPNYSFIKSIKTASVYCILFLIVFNCFFIQTFSDGTQTTNMFVLTSFLISFPVILLFAIFKRVFKNEKIFNSPLSDFLILYILSELICMCFSGEICFWGITYRFHLFANGTNDDAFIFKEKRDFAFSASFMIASILGLLQSMIFKVKKSRF